MASVTLHSQHLDPDTEAHGPPVVFLHGLFGSGTNWRSVASAIAKQHAVYLLDARNHGASGHAPSMSYADMAADMIAWLDSQNLETASIVGHSMGGKTAMLTALTHPARVARLVVVDIAPASYGEEALDAAHNAITHDGILDLMQSIDLDSLSSRAAVDAALAHTIESPMLRGFLLQNLIRSPGEAGASGLAWRIHIDAIRQALETLRDFPRLPDNTSFGNPALFVHGSASDYVRDAHVSVIHHRFPAARIESIDGAGHWLHAEQPQRMVAMLSEFLSQDSN